jgi:hypothetical protein
VDIAFVPPRAFWKENRLVISVGHTYGHCQQNASSIDQAVNNSNNNNNNLLD